MVSASKESVCQSFSQYINHVRGLPIFLHQGDNAIVKLILLMRKSMMSQNRYVNAIKIFSNEDILYVIENANRKNKMNEHDTVF